MNQILEEQMAIDRFRQVSGLWPGGATRGADPPDFTVVDGGQQVAVEMTRYHQDSGPTGSNKAAQESLEARVITKAQELFEAEHPDVHVLVSPFFMHGNLHRRHLFLYADRLARAVATLIPAASTKPLVTLSAGWQELESMQLDDVLAFLSVSRARNSRRSQWGFGGAGHLSTDVGHLLSVVRDKEADLPRYKASFDECWLIVYAMPQPSAFLDFEVLSPQMWSSEFDHVAVLDVGLARSVVVV